MILNPASPLAGNEAMAAERFYEAIELYTQAISLVDTDAIYYANRWAR